MVQGIFVQLRPIRVLLFDDNRDRRHIQALLVAATGESELIGDKNTKPW